MDNELIITVLSILAIVLSIIAIYLTKQGNNISKALNKIETERDFLEYKKGEINLLNYVVTYFICNYQRTKVIGEKFEIDTDKSFTMNYITEIELLATKFDNFINSPFYLRLHKNYPLIGTISVFLRKESMYINKNLAVQKPYGYNHDVWNKMYETFKLLRTEANNSENLRNAFSTDQISDLFKYAEQINDCLKKQNK